MSAKSFPHTIPLWARRGGGGGPPGTAADHQTAKYIVGNELAGDTLDVCDFLDPGDGTGIAAAFAAALVTPGDIYWRPGRYDLTLPTAPTLPFVTAWAQTVRGPQFFDSPFGALFGLAATSATLVVGDVRNVFEISVAPPALGYVNLYHIQLELAAATATTSGTILINNPVGVVHGCRVVLPAAPSLDETLNLLLFCKDASNCVVESSNPDTGDYANGAAGGVELTTCLVENATGNYFTQTDIGVTVAAEFSSQCSVISNTILAAARCVFFDGTNNSVFARVVGNTLGNNSGATGVTGLYVSNQARVTAAGNIVDISNGYGVYIEEFGSVDLSSNTINRSGSSGAYGVYAEDGDAGTRGGLVITGNRIFGGSSAIYAAPGMVITGNSLVAGSIGVEIPATLETNGCAITGNTFRGASVCISVGGYNATITGNVLTVVTTGVDVVASAFRTLIVGNTISGGTAIADAGTGTITGNNIT